MRSLASGRLGLFATLLVSVGSVFGVDEMPDVTMLVSLNNGLSLRAVANDFTRVTAGISGDSATDFSRMTFTVQAKPKDADDDAYVTVSGEFPVRGDNSEQRSTDGSYFLWDGTFVRDPGVYTVRARATVVASGTTTDWKTLGDVTVPIRYTGRALYSGLSNIVGAYGSDGKVATFYEHYQADEGSVAWCGQDLGKICRLTGVRLVRRQKFRPRATGALFQIADDERFTQNVRTVYTCPDTTEDFTLFEASFDAPVNARYVRVVTTGPKCCNFDEVEWVGDFLPDVEPLSATDPVPSVKWTIYAAEGVTTSQAEWSYSPDTGFVLLGEVCAGAGSFVATNADIRVGVPAYYRVRRQLAGGGEVVSPVQKLVRCRQLERDLADQTRFAAGVTLLPVSQYATSLPYEIQGGYYLPNAFDGDTTTYPEIYYRVPGDANMYTPEVVMGVHLPEAAHIGSVYAHTRDSTSASIVSRLKWLYLRASATPTDYAATNTVLLAAPPEITASGWYCYASIDTDRLYEYAFLYEGPLNAVETANSYGNVAEIRFYGWTHADEVAAGLEVATPTVLSTAFDDQTPVVSWTASDLILSSQVECAYQPEGPFWAADVARSGAGDYTFSDVNAQVGIKLYYRIAYTSVVGPTNTPAVVHTKGRSLERTSPTASLAPGVSRLNMSQYADMTGVTWSSWTGPAFDGDLTTFPDIFENKTYNAANPVVGVRLPTTAHITECWAVPRPNNLTRAGQMDIFATVTFADFEANNKVHLSANLGSALTTGWNRYVSDDPDNTYECVFGYAADNFGWCGNVAELTFFGWTEADRLASGAVYAPTGVTAEGDVKRIVLAWETAVNADTVRIERRLPGVTDWTTVGSVAASAGTYVDTGLVNCQTYEYRLTSFGLQERMLTAAAPVAATTVKPGMILIVR